MMGEVIILTAINIFWGAMWYNVGKFVGRKEATNEQRND